MRKNAYARVYSACMTLLTILLAAALALSALSMHLSGDAPAFTREKAGAALLRLLPLAGAWLLMAAYGCFFLPPVTAPRAKPVRMAAQKDAGTRARVVIAVLAIAFLALGASNGGMRDVLYKAINICTECIGLG